MAPVLFKDVGKKAKDLLKKDFVNDHEFEVEQATTSGLKFKSNGRRNGTGYDTDFEIEYKDQPAGLTVKEKLSSANDMTLEVSLENKLLDGLKVSVESVTNAGAPKSVKAGLEFQTKSTYSNLNIDLQKLTIDTASVFSYENFLVGFKTDIDTNKRIIKGADCAAQYGAKDFTVSAGLNSTMDQVSATYIHKLSGDKTQVAGTYAFNTQKGTSTFAVGCEYKPDTVSVVKGKIENSGDLSLLYSQKMNQNLTLNLGTSIKTSQLGTAGSQTIGIALKYNSK